MTKVKIKLAFLGHQTNSLDVNKILTWNSDLFEILKPIDTYTITSDADSIEWQYTDSNILQQLPKNLTETF